MKLGCSTLLFGGYDLDTALEVIARAGYDAIELVSIPGMGVHFELDQCDQYYEDIKQKVADAGLIIESVGVAGGFTGDQFEAQVKAAAALGAPYLTTSSGGASGDEEYWAAMMRRMKFARVCARVHGVKLSFKPHVRGAVNNLETAKRFAQANDSPWVGLNIDNTHLQREGDDPIEAVRQLSDWIFTARIRDFKSDDMGIGPVENQIPGKGMADVKGYWEALCQVPGLQYVVVEMVGSKDFALDEVQRVIEETIAALKSYQA
jgi:sugar phosphate isomerase/epimerase